MLTNAFDDRCPAGRFLAAILALAIACCGFPTSYADQPVDFQRQVRPLLAGKCFACHGPDEATREAGLRLDEYQSAVEDRGGYQAIQPGDHQASELWLRVVSDDPDLRMPPAGNHATLSEQEVEILARWIDQGGRYETHWAFIPPRPATLPDHPSGGSPIDALMAARLQQAGLAAAPPADRYALVRRLYLDLLGIPPTVAEADAFVHDPSPTAYVRLVDSLLSRPEYAERWARPWLDLARYADTNGYEKDRPRTIWPYRDWVIEALAADMPYDQFSIRQLAGDMLPDATTADRVATGFHRNTMLNEEGGIDPLEFRYLAMIDRVATTGTVWMGLTVGCAQCHTHKYDPITHTDFYALFGLLNGADEPELELTDAAVSEQRERLSQQAEQLEQQLIKQWLSDQQREIRESFEQQVQQLQHTARRWQVITPEQWQTTMPRLELLDDGSMLASGDTTKREVYTLTFPATAVPATAIRLEVLPHESLPGRGPGMAYYEGRRGDFFLSELTIQAADRPVALVDPSASFGHNSLGSGSADAANVLDGEGSTGWATGGAEGQANRWVANFAEPFSSDQPWTIELVFERHYAAALGRFRFSLVSEEPQSTAEQTAVALPLDAETEAALASLPAGTAIGDFPAPLLATLQRHFLATSELLKQQRQPLEQLRSRLPQPVRTLVMQQRPAGQQRVTHRYHRGEYLQPREQVQPAIPEIFASESGAGPQDRLQLAQWLVSENNPLFARVVVNRAWRDLMGRGIVHTAGDYGTQSEPPSYPELLDDLAVQFIRQGMSLKHLHREIVMSDAYQRDQRHRPAVRQVDPENQLLADGPRQRLEGERIRDSLLAAAGLLDRRIGGPSVYPPQPASVTDAAHGHVPWNVSSGGDRFRRSLYTFSKRTAPFAALLVFDGPTGEACLPRRETSNTPLQSLTLLNDAMFLEIAAALADDTLRHHPPDNDGEAASGDQAAEIATKIFRRLLVRPPTDEELAAIVQFYEQVQQHSDTPWLWVARALINLDEVVTTP